MTAPNHALTGALIGLSVSNPALAMPLAFLSHFACDAIPHYDPDHLENVERLQSKKFIREFLVVGAVICFAIVLCLALTKPKHWVTAAVCAFLATSPDLFWIPRFIRILKTKIDPPLTNPFLKFHAAIQWKTGPKLIWVEAVWFVIFGTILVTRL
jgi:hypothetical protein